MVLNTNYLGMKLRSPLVVSASSLSTTLDNIKRMEDSGAGAVVLFSLFEEQIRTEQQVLSFHHKYPLADIATFYPSPCDFRMGLEAYLDHIRQAKESVEIPIIASLNCTSLGTWTEFACEIENAGADALELNIYFTPATLDIMPDQIEASYLQILKAVKSVVQIPVAVKLTPFFTNLMSFAKSMDEAGANGLVLFNLFYGPDFDPTTLTVWHDIPLSAAQNARLALHWIAILHRQLRADLAACTGIYSVEDVIKMLMVGAKVTMLASVLFREGIDHLRVLEAELLEWLEKNDYQSIGDLQGIMTHFTGKDASATARTEYMKAITSVHGTI